MDYNNAKNILMLPDNFDEKIIKKKYRILALKYHPDKNNNDPKCSAKFIEIHQAYEFLMDKNNYQYSKDDNNTYDSIFKTFIQSLFDGNKESEILIRIVEHIVFNYETFIIDSIGKELLSKLDNETVIYVYDILCKYQLLLKISKDSLDVIHNMINERIKEDMVIVLNPSIKDLLEDNIYVLEYENDTFYIPLWHNELRYDIINNNTNKKNTLTVLCNPELPSDIELNSNGDIDIIIREKIETVLSNKGIYYDLNNKVYFINSYELKIQKYQYYTKKNIGVAEINNENIYDNNLRRNINFLIELY